MNQEIYSLKLERSNSEKAYTDTHEPLFLMPIASSNNVNLNISSSISESEDESYMSFIKQTPRHSVGDLKFTKNNKKTPQLPVFRNSESVDPCKLSINDMDEPKRLHKITESKTKRKSYLNQQKQYTRNQRYGTYTNHGFGVAFSYWKPFTTHPLCKPKYANLRDELLANRIYTISIEEYIKIWKRGKKLINQVQTILGNNGDANTASARKIAPWNDYCNIKPDDKISLDHLLSILFYTDLSELPLKMKTACREMLQNETINSIKKRHREFTHWLKLLSETIIFYGNTLSYTDNDQFSVYHGLNQQLLFESFTINLFTPTSTTTDMHQAFKFVANNKDGVVLKLGAANCIGAGYFDTSALSSFGNEKEYILFGAHLQIRGLHTSHFRSFDMKPLLLYESIVRGSMIMDIDKREECNDSLHKTSQQLVAYLDQFCCFNGIYFSPSFTLPEITAYQMQYFDTNSIWQRLLPQCKCTACSSIQLKKRLHVPISNDDEFKKRYFFATRNNHIECTKEQCMSLVKLLAIADKHGLHNFMHTLNDINSALIVERELASPEFWYKTSILSHDANSSSRFMEIFDDNKHDNFPIMQVEELNKIQYLQDAMLTYQTLLAKPLNFNPVYMISDNLNKIINIIKAFTHIVNVIMKKNMCIQIDLVIIPRNTYRNKANSVEYIDCESVQTKEIDFMLQNGLSEKHKKDFYIDRVPFDLSELGIKNVIQKLESAPFSADEGRYVVVVDRQQLSTKNEQSIDYMYLFKPLNEYGNINGHKTMVEILHLNTLECLFPIINNDDSLLSQQKYVGAKHLCQGKMICISFHVLTDDKLRCYLYVDQKCTRINLDDTQLKKILEEYMQDTAHDNDNIQQITQYDKFSFQAIDEIFDHDFKWVKSEITKANDEKLDTTEDEKQSVENNEEDDEHLQQLYSTETQYGLKLLSHFMNKHKTIHINSEQIRTSQITSSLKDRFVVQDSDGSITSYSANLLQIAETAKIKLKSSQTYYWCPLYKELQLFGKHTERLISKMYNLSDSSGFYCEMKSNGMSLVFNISGQQTKIISCTIFCLQMNFFVQYQYQSLTKDNSRITTFFEQNNFLHALHEHNRIDWEITISQHDAKHESENNDSSMFFSAMMKKDISEHHQKLITEIMNSEFQTSSLERKILHHSNHIDIGNKIENWLMNDLKFQKDSQKTMQIFAKYGLSGQNIMQIPMENIQLILERDLLSIMTPQTFEMILSLLAKVKLNALEADKNIEAPKMGFLVYKHPLNQLLDKITDDKINGKKLIHYYQEKHNWIKNVTGWEDNDIHQIHVLLFQDYVLEKSEIEQNINMTLSEPLQRKLSLLIQQNQIDLELLCYQINKGYSIELIEKFSDLISTVVDEYKTYVKIAQCFWSETSEPNLKYDDKEYNLMKQSSWNCHNCGNANFSKYINGTISLDLIICSLCNMTRIEATVKALRNESTYTFIKEKIIHKNTDRVDEKKDDIEDLINTVQKQETFYLKCFNTNKSNSHCQDIIETAKHLIEYKRLMEAVYQDKQSTFDNVYIGYIIIKHIPHIYEEIFLECIENILDISDDSKHLLQKMFRDNVGDIKNPQSFYDMKGKEFQKFISTQAQIKTVYASKLYRLLRKSLKQEAIMYLFLTFLSNIDMHIVDQQYHHIIKEHIHDGNNEIIENTFNFFQKTVHYDDTKEKIAECRSFKRRQAQNDIDMKQEQDDKQQAIKTILSLKQHYAHNKLDLIHSFLVHSDYKQFTNGAQQFNINNQHKYVSKSDEYGFGIAHSYPYSKPKYESLKKEMLCNNIYRLTHKQFKLQLMKAINMNQIAKHKYQKQLICKYYKKEFNIIRNEPIGIKHMLALVVYTDMSAYC
eukprot:241312_1